MMRREYMDEKLDQMKHSRSIQEAFKKYSRSIPAQPSCASGLHSAPPPTRQEPHLPVVPKKKMDPWRRLAGWDECSHANKVDVS